MLAGAACQSAPRQRVGEVEVCTRREYLLVRNENRVLMEIYVHEGDSKILLGTVRDGQTEFLLHPRRPGPRSFSGARVRGSYEGEMSDDGKLFRRLEFKVECR